MLSAFGVQPEKPEDKDPIPVLTCKKCGKGILIEKVIEPRVEAQCDGKPPCGLDYHKHCWAEVQKYVNCTICGLFFETYVSTSQARTSPPFSQSG
jgi:uncharacterized protein (DUF983 family)